MGYRFSGVCRLLGVSCVLIVSVGGLLVPAPGAGAEILFQEDFNGYLTSNGGAGFNNASDPVNHGLPLQSEGADSFWYGGRFETPDTPNPSDLPPLEHLDYDLAVQKIPGAGRPSPDPVGKFEDDAGLVLRVDLTNHAGANLMFDWRNFLGDTGDKIVVGYHVGDDLGFDANHRLRDFYGDPAVGNGSQSAMESWWDDEWTELLRARNEKWSSESFNLGREAAGEVVYVAFWVDDGEGDYVKIDNVKVTAKPIPEPASVGLLAVSLIAVSGRRRRRGR